MYERLSTVWLLLYSDCIKKENHISRILQVFLTAEMNKQVALYSLPSGNKTTGAVITLSIFCLR